MKSYYTVDVKSPGYPVYFLCPYCIAIHSYPENPKEANFQDAGEASQEFKIATKYAVDMEFVVPSVLAQMAVSIYG